MLAFGFVALTRFIGFQRPLAVLALTFYAFGTVAVMGAATMSGFVMPQLVEAAHAPGAAQTGVYYQGLAQLTHWLNQGFAHVHVALMSVALALYALAWPGKGVPAWAMRGLGLVVGVGVLAWQLSDTLVLNVHGMGAVVIAHGVWTLAAAAALWHGAKAAS